MKKRLYRKAVKLPGILGLLLIAAAFGFFLGSGMEAQAAEKKLPLVNLAEKKTDLSTGQDMSITSPEKITDGDKYNLKHNDTGNKVNNQWEPYEEADGVTTVTGPSGAPVWIQLDLGAEYPIEVINLKRKMYNGNNQRYTNTAVVIGNREDLSDGEVVYCQGDVTLPQGVERPAETSDIYQEAMGGQWFYMDYSRDKGLGYTPLGTVKKARYVRVYSQNPTSDSVDFMELAVYGYEDEQSVQKPIAKRKQIDNEHPLMIAAAYSSDTFFIGQEENVGLQGYNTIAGRWNAIPDDLKPYNVLMMHSNNLGGANTPHHVGQALLQEYSEACLQEGYEADASLMLMVANASAVPGGSSWCITRSLDFHWVDLMYRMYPSMEGVFSTENFWSGSHGAVANALAELLNISNLHGGYVVYSEADHNNIYDNVMSNANLRRAVANGGGDSLFFTYKNTQGSNDGLHSQSALMGSWLSGYIGGWGMLSDTWAWGNSGNGPLWHTSGGFNKAWKTVCAEPEAIFGMQMLTTYLNGGCVYTFEFPEVVYGAIDENSPAYAHVVEQVFRYICENPAPDRGQVLSNTKVMLYGDADSSLYASTVGADNAMALLKNGRYGAIPTIPLWGTQEEVTNKLKETAKKEGSSAPAVISNSNVLLSYGVEEYFNQLYPLEYLGNAFAEKCNEAWYIYNNSINTNVTQDATFALEAGEASGTARFKASLEPHAFVILKEGEDNLQISLNNYRVDKQELIFNNIHGWRWDGSSATGQGVSEGKKTIYRYMAYYNCVNAKSGVPNIENPGQTIDQLSPNDHDLRTSTFEISSLSSAPTVEVIEGQKADTDGRAQYNDPVVTYDSSTKTATVTIESNGWVKLKVTNLHYQVDDNAVEIVEPTETEEYGTSRINLALNKTVSASHASSTGAGMSRPLNRIVDDNVTAGNYTDPGSNTGGPVWVQVDLGNQHRVDEVQLFRYFEDGRQYCNTVVLLSPDKDFAPDKTLVLWNANGSNGGRGGAAVASWEGRGNGQLSGTHTLPEGDEPLYAETSTGKSFKVWDSTVEWLDGSTSRPKPQENEYFDARYVRVYMNGHKRTNGNEFAENHVVEVRAFGLERLGTPVDSSVNLALTSSVSVSGAVSGDRSMKTAVDGQKGNSNNYTDPGGAAGGPHWIELDLGIQHNIELVKLYRYWTDSRQYYNTVVMLSTDADFPADSTLVLYNGNGANGGRNGSAVTTWQGDGNGGQGTHTIPEGNDPTYAETADGKTFQVYDSTVCWLDPNKTDPLPGEPGGNNRFQARYVRVYMNGSTVGATNHVVEIEVFGEAGEFVLNDTEAPEMVMGLELEKNYPRRAVVSFLPSMDNMGLKEYELTLKEEGGQPKTIILNQTRYEFTGLEPDTTYEVSVIAVDNYGNKSEKSNTLIFTTPLESDFVVSADLESGTYPSVQKVTLSAPLNSGEIYYTLDGSYPFDQQGEPTPQAILYDGEAFEINHSCVLSAALKTGDDVWPASSYNYQIGVKAKADFEAPSAPTRLVVDNISSAGATISWDSASPDVKAYYVYVNGVKKAEIDVAEAARRATLTNLTPLTAYRIYVTAVDEAGNESLRSETTEFVTREP